MSVTASRAQHVITVLSLGLAAFLLLSQLTLFWQFHTHLPFKDTWHFLPLVKQVLEHGWLSTDMSAWLEPHALAHRVVLSRTLMTLDYQWLNGQNHLLYASAWLSTGCLLVIFTKAFWAINHAHSQRVFQLSLAVIFLLAPGQFFNFLNPINASWFTAMAFSAGALYLAQRGGVRAITSACLLGCLAAFSNFSGALVLLLIPIAVFLGQNPGRQVAVAGIFCLLILGLYQVGVQSGLGVLLDYRLQHPEEFDESVATLVMQTLWSIGVKTLGFLGSPLSSLHPLISGSTVCASLLLLAVSLGRAIPRKLATSDSSVFFLLMACLCAGIALATQLGRILFDGADALRYQTVATTYWLSITGLLYCQRSPFSAQVLSSLLVLVLVLAPLGRDASPEAGSINAGLRAEVLAEIGNPDIARYRQTLPMHAQDPLPVYSHFLLSRQLAFAANSDICDATNCRLLPRRKALSGTSQLSGEQRPQLQLPATLFSVVVARRYNWEAITP